MIDSRVKAQLRNSTNNADTLTILMPYIDNTGFSTGSIQRSARATAARGQVLDTYGMKGLLSYGADETLFRAVNATTEAIVDRMYQVQQRGTRALVGGGERAELPVSSLGFRPALRAEMGQTYLGRMTNNMSNVPIDLANKSKGYQTLKRQVRNFGLDPDTLIGKTRGGRIIRGRQGDNMEGLLEKGESYESLFNVDDALYRFASSADGNSVPGFLAVRDIFNAAELRMIDDGIAPEFARAATRLVEEQATMSRFNTGGMGDVAKYPGSSFKTLLNDQVTDMPGVQLLSEMWGGSINVPNASLLRKTLAEKPNAMIQGLTGMDIGVRKGLNYLTTRKTRLIALDNAVGDTLKIREAMNPKGWKGGDKNFNWVPKGDLQRRASLLYADAFMSNVWKPMKLLRIGYFAKVVLGDEQMRITAAGLSSIWAPGRKGESPLAYLAYLLSSKKARIDIKGNQISNALEYKNTVSLKPNAYGEMGGMRSESWISMPKHDARYDDGLATEWLQLSQDPIARKLLEPQFGDDTIALTKDWLLNDPKGKDALKTITDSMASEAYGVVPAIRMRDGDQWLDVYLEGVNARLQLKTGGDYIWVDPNNKQVFDSNNDWIGAQGVDEFENVRDGVTITRAGDTDVLEGLRTQTMDGVKISSGDIKPSSYNKVRKYARKRIEAEAENGVKYPDGVKYNDTKYGKSDDPKLAKRVMDRAMRILVSSSAERLNRSPVFRQFYWDAVAERIPLMSPKARAKVYEMAAEAKMTKRVKTVADEAAVAYRKAGGGSDGILDDFDQVDLYAKSFAAEATKDLLFDFAERKNMFDALSILAPFADAWLEQFTAWGRIFANDPALIRRPLKAYGELQDSDPTVWGEEEFKSDDGFFYENSYGEEVFNIPLGQEFANALSKLPFISDDVPDMDFPVSTKSLSMMSQSAFPPAGPVLSIPAAGLLPNTPEFQWFRDALFPFGLEDTMGQEFLSETLGGSTTLTKLLNGFTKGTFISGDDERVYNNVVGLMIRELVDSGEFTPEDLQDPDANVALLAKARDNATSSYYIRAVIGNISPYGPGAPSIFPDETTLADFDGNEGEFTLLALQDASSAYWNIREGDGTEESLSESETTKIFWDKYGYDPLFSLVSRTEDKWKRGVTQAAADAEKRNASTFEALPATAYYLYPDDPDDPFAYDAYSFQFAQGNKTVKPLEEQLNEWQFRMGKREYDFYTEQLDELFESEEIGVLLAENDMSVVEIRDILLANKKKEIRNNFSGYRQIEGTFSSAAQQKQELEELRQWSSFSEVANMPVAVATNEYLNFWDEMYQAQLSLGVGTSETVSMPFRKPTNLNQFSAKGDISENWIKRSVINAKLIEKGDQLAKEQPSFAAVWEGVFKPKIFDYSAEVPDGTLSPEEFAAQQVESAMGTLVGG